MDPETLALLQQCWSPDTELRPSFSVIRFRLETIARRVGNEEVAKVRDEKDARELRGHTRAIHDLIWLFRPADWDQRAAESLLSAKITATAKDEMLRNILGSGSGYSCIKSLGWLMFSGFEDGSEIMPEPLLDEHIVVCDAQSGT